MEETTTVLLTRNQIELLADLVEMSADEREQEESFPMFSADVDYVAERRALAASLRCQIKEVVQSSTTPTMPTGNG